MQTEFTPLWSLSGGVMIGIGAIVLMAALGRIMGATGILAGVVAPTSRPELSWRIAVLLGMITGPAVIFGLSGEMPEVQIPVSLAMTIIGGVLVGLGVTFASGCTSGHGVCGIARLSPRSIVATMTFMITTACTVYVIRHVLGG